jgi:hypothetical protein
VRGSTDHGDGSLVGGREGGNVDLLLSVVGVGTMLALWGFVRALGRL